MSLVKISGRSGELSLDIDIQVADEPFQDSNILNSADQVAYSSLGELANKLTMLSDETDPKVSVDLAQTFKIDGDTSVVITGRASFRSMQGLVYAGISEAVFRVATSVIMGLMPIDVTRTMKLMGAAGLQQPQVQQVPQTMSVQPVLPGDDFTGQYL